MTQKEKNAKFLLLEPDKKQGDLFSDWLREEGFIVRFAQTPKQAASLLAQEQFDMAIVDMDSPEYPNASMELRRTAQENLNSKDLPIVVITYKKSGAKIAGALSSCADNFILKPFETDSFIERVKIILRETDLKEKGNKILDLNYINFLIHLMAELSREDFFILAPVIFNKLIVDKIKPVIGDPIISQIIKRIGEIIGRDYPFMKEASYTNGQIAMNGVDLASRKDNVKKMTLAFRDYIFAFVHIVNSLTSNILVSIDKL